MARKSLQELSGIASAIARSGPKTADRSTKQSTPALGALQGSLSAIREIDPHVIDDWGPVDRLDEFTDVNLEEESSDGFEALKTSIAEGGQQVPVLVRRSQQEGRYEVIYGRRRIKACRELGVKVRANIQDLDDATALLAKGLENAARRNLSFYEKARFAKAIRDAGYDSATVRQVLSVSKSGLSHLNKVVENIPVDVGNRIGSAARSGRPKWTALAEAFVDGKINAETATAFLDRHLTDTSSDERLEMLLKEILRRGARPHEGRESTPVPGVVIRSGRGAITVSVKRSGESAAFAEWLEGEIEELIQNSFREFTDVNAKS